MLLRAYEQEFTPESHLLPDACHHVHRLWTSLRLAQEQQNRHDCLGTNEAAALTAAIHAWKSTEDAVILSFDGIDSRKLEKD